MQRMGLAAIYQRPTPERAGAGASDLSLPVARLSIELVHQVWAADLVIETSVNSWTFIQGLDYARDHFARHQFPKLA